VLKWENRKIETNLQQKMSLYFCLLEYILYCVIVRFGCIGALGFEWFSLYYFVLRLLIVNFLRVVSTSGCRLIKPNHLNFGVLCDWFFWYLLISRNPPNNHWHNLFHLPQNPYLNYLTISSKLTTIQRVKWKTCPIYHDFIYNLSTKYTQLSIHRRII
jgi:hypothetical protein